MDKHDGREAEKRPEAVQVGEDEVDGDWELGFVNGGVRLWGARSGEAEGAGLDGFIAQGVEQWDI